MIDRDIVLLPRMQLFAASICCKPIIFVCPPIMFYKLPTGSLSVIKGSATCLPLIPLLIYTPYLH